MLDFNAALLTDGYKTGHHKQYPEGTEEVYSTWIPRSFKHAPEGINFLLNFGTQAVIKWLINFFDKNFFALDEDAAIEEAERELGLYLGHEYNADHFRRLHRIGFLPVRIKTLPEGILVPKGVPTFSVRNTQKRRKTYWVTNFIETILSNMAWMPSTSATTAFQYRKILETYQRDTNPEMDWFVDWQGHDFSMRGMAGLDAAILSAMGHGIVFSGSDTLPVVPAFRKFYNVPKDQQVVGSVNATEHSVMCVGTAFWIKKKGLSWEYYGEAEKAVFIQLIKDHPGVILSIVSDTWDLWKVILEYLRDPEVKQLILEREGKIVIRPDSGDPVDIVCGKGNNYRDLSKYYSYEDGPINHPEYFEDVLLDEVREDTPHGEHGPTEYTQTYQINGKFYAATIHNISWNRHDKQYYYVDMWETAKITIEELEFDPLNIGVVELIWNEYGGTDTSTGFKQLNDKIGVIYGDAITLDRCKRICERLKLKGFASTNVVFGIGSYTYQFKTRDTYGFAMKASWAAINIDGTVHELEVFKDPITNDGTKKSLRGMCYVYRADDGVLAVTDQCTPEEEAGGLLQLLYEDGAFYNEVDLSTLRETVKKELELELSYNEER